MKEERMLILKMVEDNKISADDAVKLLAAISKSKKGFEANEWQSGLDDKVKKFAKNMDEMGKELGKKLEEVGKDVEPAIKKVAQTIIDKTAECVDEISKTFKKSEDCGCESEDCGCEGKDENGDSCECCCASEGDGVQPEENCACADEPKEN